MSTNPLKKLMNPGSIALVGASNNPNKMGSLQYLSLLHSGFPGEIFAVHERDETVLGRRAFRSPADLPSAPDLAVLIVPAPRVASLLGAFGEIGTRRAIIISAGFRETGEDGGRLERDVLETAHRFEIRFVGPNCMGVINTHLPLNTTVMPVLGPQGKLGLASQSGTYVAQTVSYLNKRGIRFSQALSLGNEADIDMVDAIEYLGEDPGTHAIALYIEGIRRGERFLEVAREVSKRKPIVAQYVGGTGAGARAAATHTGALAGPASLYEGLFRSAGVITAETVEDLYDFGHALATAPRLRGNRIAILTNSGGPGTAMATTLEKHGLAVPPFSAPLQEKIRKIIPAHGSGRNPIDLTFHLDMEAMTRKLPRLLFESDEIDGVLTHGIMDTGFARIMIPHLENVLKVTEEDFIAALSTDLDELVEMPHAFQKPLLASAFFDSDDHCVKTLMDHEIPTFTTPEKAARAMAALDQYRRAHELLRAESPGRRSGMDEEAIAPLVRGALDEGASTLDEFRSKRVLALCGIATVAESLAETQTRALGDAEAIGYPVVLKACSPAIAHKTGKGLVELDIRGPEELGRAFDRIRVAAPGAPILVQRMIRGDRELMAGVVRLAGFPPFVLFGLGGIWAEAIADRTFRAAPLSMEMAVAMAEGIRSSRILADSRGTGPVNVRRVAEILVALGELALQFPEIREIDVNPLVVAGGEPVAVDALIVLKEPGA